MIDLYYWLTPYGHKISIAVEKIGLGHDLIPVHMDQGARFPNNLRAITNR